MTHPDEGTLQAFLDHELPAVDRPAVAEHLLACAQCRVELDGLTRANDRLAAALSELDVPAPAASPPATAARRRRFGGGAVVRAAALVLVLAAAASAAVPGSPVREWIAQAVRSPAEPEPATPAPVVAEPTAPEAPAAPAGIALTGVRTADVIVTRLEDMAIRLVRTRDSGVAVSARGGARDPLFRMGSNRIEVVGGAGGELLVEIPHSTGRVRLVVDGRPYADAQGTALRVLVEPTRRDGEAILWQ